MHRWICVSCLAAVLLASCAGNEPAPTAVPAPPAEPVAAAPADASGYQIVQVADGGSISGTILVSGAIPKQPMRDVKKDAPVCGSSARPSERLIVSKAGGLKNAVVMVEDVKSGKAFPAELNPTIDQKGCEYTPHVQVMKTGTELNVVNSDPVLHNIHMYQNDDSLFNIAQPVKDQSNKRKIEKAGMVYAECDVHGWMQAHIAVVDNPYFAVTDENGKFTIKDLPAGSYKVKVWHEYLGDRTETVQVAARADAALNLDLKDLLAAKSPAPAPVTAAPAAAPGAAPAAAGDKANAAPKAAAGAGPVVTVQMISEGSGFRFSPDTVTVKVGTTVKWVNASENKHTSTADPKFEKKAGAAVVPAGAQPWSSAFLNNGEEYSRTFTVPGTYSYFCRNHEQFGMIAKIVVQP